VTLYEAENASGLANGQPFPSLGLRDKPVQNADGSTDLYLGPKAPQGKEGNWLATVPGRGYFAILRLLRPYRSGHRQEMEACRHREGEVSSKRKRLCNLHTHDLTTEDLRAFASTLPSLRTQVDS